MSRQFTIGLFVLLLVCALTIQWAYAQGTSYIVTGDQPINARQCPRLNCPIVKRLAPGTRISVVGTVSGDTVFGSDQWAQVEDDGVEMFVHSALVKPAPESQPTATPAAEDSTLVDTSTWIVHQVNRSKLLAPPMWQDIDDLATDEEFLADIEEMYGKAERDWYVEMQQACENGEYDLVLVELDGSGALRIGHVDRSGTPLTGHYVKRVIETGFTSYGAQVVGSDVTQFPAGEGVRVKAVVSVGGVVTSGDIVYMVLTEKDMYSFELTFAGAAMNPYTAIIDAVVNSFDYNPSNT